MVKSRIPRLRVTLRTFSQLWWFHTQRCLTNTAVVVLGGIKSQRGVWILQNQTAVALRFVNAVTAVVSDERLREEKKKKKTTLNRFHFQTSFSFCGPELSDRANYQQQHNSLRLSITNISIPRFPFHLPVSHSFHGSQNNQLQSPFFH